MGASTLSFDGRNTAVPQAVTKLDASALQAQGLRATGTVAIIGSSEGGRPVTATLDVDDFIRLNDPAQIRDHFRSGDLFEGAAICFDPSPSEDVGGAQIVYAMKTDQSTQSTAVLANAIGDAQTVTSTQYGQFTTATSVNVEAATSAGRKVTVTFENTVETADNVGLVSGTSAAMFSLRYDEPTSGNGGWDTMTCDVLGPAAAGGIRCYASRAELGQNDEITTAAVGTLPVLMRSADGSDTTQTVTVYGEITGNVPARETRTLNGTTDVPFTTQFVEVFGATISAATAGNITIEDSGVPAVHATITAGTLTAGVVLARTMYVADTTLHFLVDGTSVQGVHLWGKAPNGQTQSSRVALTSAVALRPTTTWSEIDVIVMGDVEVARTVTIRSIAAETSNTGGQDTLAKAQAYFNGRQIVAASAGGTTSGFLFTMNTGSTAFLVADMDLTADGPTDIDGAAGGFTAINKAVEDFFDNQSELVTSARTAFVRKVYTLTVTTADAGTGAWTIAIDGTTLTYTSDASPTIAEITAGVAAVVNNNTTVKDYVTATATATTVVLTGVTPRSGDGFISVLTPQAGAGVWTQALTTAQSGSGQAPVVQSAPVFLAGGADVAETAADYTTALNRLRLIDINTIVVLSGDPAVHAAVDTHCAYMAGAGKSERDAVIGLSALDGSDLPTGVNPSKSSIKDQIFALNTRHIGAVAQSIVRASAATGLSATHLPWFYACAVAGIQAGTPGGTAQTRKLVKCTKFTQDSSWDPSQDADEMIRAGLMVLERHRTGFRIVRSVSTHLATSNLAFVERSTNEASNLIAFNFRTRLDAIVGQNGYSGTADAIKADARGVLNEMMETGEVAAWDKDTLKVSITGDRAPVSVQVSPAIPINFIPISIFLVPFSVAA